VPTGDLADKLERTVLGQGEPWDYVRVAAARLRELEALEPVGRLLAWLEPGAALMVDQLTPDEVLAEWQEPDGRSGGAGRGATPAEALAALVKVVAPERAP
jgi:hypothetical protein